ncbi:MAG TPA: hypothetical protein VI796_00565 [Candidatus Thermoplasmatota archaeon]|nr:hypothetical protein [Candidatus Thermoplasmatota archaeon]
MAWLVVIGVGLGLLALASLTHFFTHIDDVDSKDRGSAAFYEFGAITVGVGLALAGFMQKGLPWGPRAAMVLGACYFLIQAGMATNLTSIFAALFGGGF